MYIIIAGAGIIGRQLTIPLVENKHDVIVIDKDAAVCQGVFEETGAVTIHGDATNLNVLKQAGAGKADAIICLMHYSADNISCSLLAKSLGIPHIIARLRDPQYEPAYKLAGVTTIVRMADLLVNMIMMEVERPKVRKIITLGGGKADIYQVRVPSHARCVSMTIREVTEDRNFPDECVFVGIFREESEEFFIPRGNQRLHENDSIFLSAKSQDIKRATDYLIKV
ncbi:MAG: TrkA family potassium uptake protein [Candidatus Krumholzibacteriota bacterium]|nr:TrkA family potassium uptake protein [Candidatus Krumholzibacteriota bacterium]